jgi:hypothetical protein
LPARSPCVAVPPSPRAHARRRADQWADAHVRSDPFERPRCRPRWAAARHPAARTPMDRCRTTWGLRTRRPVRRSRETSPRSWSRTRPRTGSAACALPTRVGTAQAAKNKVLPKARRVLTFPRERRRLPVSHREPLRDRKRLRGHARDLENAWVVPCGAGLQAVEEGAEAGAWVLTVNGKEPAELGADSRPVWVRNRQVGSRSFGDDRVVAGPRGRRRRAATGRVDRGRRSARRSALGVGEPGRSAAASWVPNLLAARPTSSWLPAGPSS